MSGDQTDRGSICTSGLTRRSIVRCARSWCEPSRHLRSIEWADYSRQVIADRPHLSTRTIETDRLCHDRVKAWIGDTPSHASHTNSSAA